MSVVNQCHINLSMYQSLTSGIKDRLPTYRPENTAISDYYVKTESYKQHVVGFSLRLCYYSIEWVCKYFNSISVVADLVCLIGLLYSPVIPKLADFQIIKSILSFPIFDSDF